MKIFARINLIFLAALPCIAQDASFYIQFQQNSLTVSARLVGVKEEEIFSALEEGMEAEIAFQIRVYEKTRGLFSFFGDKLIVQDTPSFLANLDRLNNNYVIRHQEGEDELYTDKNTFLAQFLRLDRYVIADFRAEMDKEYYLLARVHLIPARLTGPLTIISLFFRTGHTTDWIELNLDTGGAS